MKFCDYDMSLLIKECEDFIFCMEEKELDNDCSAAEQILFNAVCNVVLAFNIINEN